MPKHEYEPVQILQVFEMIEEKLVNPLLETNRRLESELEKANQEIEGLKQQVKAQVNTSFPPNVGLAEIEALKKEVASLKELIKNLKVAPDQYDLKNEGFKFLALVSALELDKVGQIPTATILNQIFKSCLKKANNPTGCQDYQFSARVLDYNLTLKQWISGNTAKFKIGSNSFDNTFDTAQPEEKKVSLGTGTGKSTFFLRCLAHRNPDGGGATLVVPYASLISSVLDAHNNWLSKNDSKDERVSKCLICDQNHTSYQTTHNSVSQMINVFTWWEFLEAYLNNPSIIKPWVVFDEAHTDLPAYQALIRSLLKVKNRLFKIVQMSATFGDLPTSKKLTGTINDYYLSDFNQIFKINQEVFNKKVLVFCDDFNQIDFKPLADNGIKYLTLNDSLKEYASDIVRSLEAPLLIFANRDYSVGFSFGDVNVISTGIALRNVVGDKGVERSIIGVSDFADLLQERGRSARDPTHTGIWMSLIPHEEGFKGKLKGDYLEDSIVRYFKIGDEASAKSAIKLAKRPKPLPDLDPREGNLNLNRVLVRSLKEKLDPTTLFNLKPSEKGKRQLGEFIFTNKLMKYFNEQQLPDLLIEATKDKIISISDKYEWYRTPKEDDDWVFNNETDTKLVGFYLQAREKYDCRIEKTKAGENYKLILKFSPYTLDKNKVKV